MGRKKKPGKNTSLALIFLIVIVLAIFASILVKVLLVVKASKFGEGPTFSIFVSSSKENKILTFLKDKKSISVIKFEGKVGDIYKLAEVPISATFHLDDFNFDRPVAELSSDIFFGLPRATDNLNTFDALRMMIMAKTTQPKDIHYETIAKGTREDEIDKMLSSYFLDEKLDNENIAIQVINASGRQGLGNRLARIISNIGGNVVLVSNSDNEEKSRIYEDEESYTSKRLSEVLNFPQAEDKMEGIGDIIVVVGEDYDRLSKY